MLYRSESKSKSGLPNLKSNIWACTDELFDFPQGPAVEQQQQQEEQMDSSAVTLDSSHGATLPQVNK